VVTRGHLAARGAREWGSSGLSDLRLNELNES